MNSLNAQDKHKNIFTQFRPDLQITTGIRYIYHFSTYIISIFTTRLQLLNFEVFLV